MYVKLLRSTLVGSIVQPKGAIVPATGRYAELLVKSGAGIAVSPPIESATAEPRSARAAVAPRQGA